LPLENGTSLTTRPRDPAPRRRSHTFLALFVFPCASLLVLAESSQAQPCKFADAINAANDEGFGLALQTDGKIVIAGYSNRGGSEDDFAVARYNSDCSPDATFNSTGAFGGPPNLPGVVTTNLSAGDRDQAIDVTLQSDGKIVAVGLSRTGGTIPRIALVRYNADGSLDGAFGGGSGIAITNLNSIDDQGRDVAVQADGKIVVAGWSRTGVCGAYPNQCVDTAVLRYLPNGNLDTAGFNSPNGYVILNVSGGNANDYGHAVAIQSSDGRIVLGGDTENGVNDNVNVLRFNVDGSLDPSWGGTGIVTTDVSGTSDTCRDVAIQSDFKILAGGKSGSPGSEIFAVTRYGTTGVLDGSFDTDGRVFTSIGGIADYIHEIALQSDGKIVAAGQSYNGANWDFALTRYNTNGSLDTGFDSDGIATTSIASSHDTAFSVAVEPDGEIVVVGSTNTGANLDFGLVRYSAAGTTAVRLASLTATGLDGAVELEWETASELNNLGFHLYRSASSKGPHERITAGAIPGLGSSPVGARYRYVDYGLENGAPYFYELEDIESSGRTNRHGPVKAVPRANAASGSGADSESRGDSPGIITYGDPSANSLRVLSRHSSGVVLELRTEGFYAVLQADGKIRLEIPGWEATGGEKPPAIPVRRAWVEALAGRSVELSSVEARRVETIDGWNLAETDDADRAGANLYPEQDARLVNVGFQGNVKKALVEMAPLRWDGSKGRLLLTRALVVKLVFRGRETAEENAHGARRSRKRRPAGSRVAAHLVTTDRGLYAVRYEEVFGRRPGGESTGSLRLSRQGRAVPFHVEPDAVIFRPGSTLYFLGEGARANPFGREAVYELEVGIAGETMPVLVASPSGESAPFYWELLEREENRFYQAGLLDAADLWLWDLLFAPIQKEYPVEITALASNAETSHLAVWLQGASDLPASPDHHVRVFVNGLLVKEVRWDGKRPRKVDAELAPGLLREGRNELSIENLGEPGAAYSMVMLDRFELSYPRSALARNGTLEGRWGRSGAALIPGLGVHPRFVGVDGEKPYWLEGARAMTGGWSFRAEKDRTYLAVADDALLRPAVRAPVPSRLRDRRNQADYILIGPRAFLEAARPLVSLRRGQGMSLKQVPVEEIYSEFGHGEATPDSIRDFLEYAYHDWRRPSPRYVLLLGDATYDPKDFLRTGVDTRVPARIVATTYLWTASDPSFALVNGDDLLPDLAIGRLPAATEDEVRVLVNKIVSWETTSARLEAPVVFVADNPDGAGDFAADADRLASNVPGNRDVRQIYLGGLGVSDTRAAIVDAFDRGASLVSYAGHGGIQVWADENLLDNRVVRGLSAQPQQPVLLTMNCLNGYFHFPYFNSLSEELLKAEGKGAIAAISPSGFSLNGAAHRYHEALLKELLRGSHRRLGDAFLAAQASYAESGSFPELLILYHLFGDPALEIR